MIKIKNYFHKLYCANTTIEIPFRSKRTMYNTYQSKLKKGHVRYSKCSVHLALKNKLPYRGSQDMNSNSVMTRNSPSHETFPSTSNLQSNSLKSQDDQGYTVVRHKKKNPGLRPTSRTKVYLPELIQVVGLMEEVNSQQILTRPCYFGKYGEIAKVYFYGQGTQYYSKNKNTAAFIYYKSQISAALALVAMQNYRHCGERVFCNPGTQTFCHQYLRREICRNAACIYLHKNSHEYREVQRSNYRKGEEIRKESKVKLSLPNSLNFISEQLYRELSNQASDDYNACLLKCSCSSDCAGNARQCSLIKFPSIDQVLLSLIQQSLLNRNTYNQLRLQVNQKIRAQNKKLSLKQESKDEESRITTQALLSGPESSEVVQICPEYKTVSSYKRKWKKLNNFLNPQAPFLNIQSSQPTEQASHSKKCVNQEQVLTALVYQRLRRAYSRGNPQYSSLFNSKLDNIESVNKIRQALLSITDQKIV